MFEYTKKMLFSSKKRRESARDIVHKIPSIVVSGDHCTITMEANERIFVSSQSSFIINDDVTVETKPTPGDVISLLPKFFFSELFFTKLLAHKHTDIILAPSNVWKSMYLFSRVSTSFIITSHGLHFFTPNCSIKSHTDFKKIFSIRDINFCKIEPIHHQGGRAPLQYSFGMLYTGELIKKELKAQESIFIKWYMFVGIESNNLESISFTFSKFSLDGGFLIKITGPCIVYLQTKQEIALATPTTTVLE